MLSVEKNGRNYTVTILMVMTKKKTLSSSPTSERSVRKGRTWVEGSAKPVAPQPTFVRPTGSAPTIKREVVMLPLLHQRMTILLQMTARLAFLWMKVMIHLCLLMTGVTKMTSSVAGYVSVELVVELTRKTAL